jgi:hypothetical protein
MCSRVTCHHVYSSTLDLEIVLWIIDLSFVLVGEVCCCCHLYQVIAQLVG